MVVGALENKRERERIPQGVAERRFAKGSVARRGLCLTRCDNIAVDSEQCALNTMEGFSCIA